MGDRIRILEFNSPVTSSPASFTGALREFTVHHKRTFIVIVHGIPESTSSDINSKFAGDKKSFTEILSQLSNTLLDDFKTIRLRRNIVSNPRPIKVILKIHDVTSKVFSAFHFIQ